MALATLSIDLIAKVASFEKDLQRTVKVVESSSRDMSNAIGLVKSGLAGLVGAFSVGVAVNFVKSTINSVDALNDLKDATGSSIENLSALEDIALRSGNSVDSMADSLVKFNKVLNEAKAGSDLDKTLKSIGLNAEELRKIDPAEALQKTAQALATYADDGNKARLIQDLFGKSIREAGPWLKDLAEAGKLNGTVTKDQADEAERFNKELAKLSKNSLDASRSLIENYLPALNEILEAYRTGGFVAGTNAVGNALFDWEGSQQRKSIKNMQKDLEDLRAQEAGITLDVFGIKGKVQAEIKATEAALKAAQNAYFKLTNVQGGRGTVNPPTPDARVSAPAPFSKEKPGKTAPFSKEKPGKKVAEEIDDNAKALAQYVRGLEKATETSLDLSEVEKARIFLTTIGTTGEIAQVQELVLGMAKRIDQEKEYIELLKLKRAASAAAGDAVNADNAWFQAAKDATPSAKLEKQRADMQRLAAGFTSGAFGDPASIEAMNAYSEAASTMLGNISDGVVKVEGDFDKLGATFASSLEDAIVKGEGLRSVIQGLGQDILRITVRKTVTEPIGNAVSGLFSGFSLSKLFGFAEGGVMTGAGPLPLRRYASGGVASSPQLAMYGEGSVPEAFVPLPDGRRIPVQMRGGGGGRAVVVNISNVIGNVASQTDVVAGMKTVRAQILGELARGQRMGGSYA
jgi:hypothetical protein